MTKGVASTPDLAAAPRAPRSHWELLERGAELGVRGVGATKAGAFEQAALALTAVIADPSAIAPREMVEIVCEGADDEMLLVAWLNAVVTEMADRGMLFSRFHVELRPRQVVASASGERVSVERHHPGADVKRVTDRAVRVARTRGGEWIAQALVDT
jgi:SHS2 domain-containing protein